MSTTTIIKETIAWNAMTDDQRVASMTLSDLILCREEYETRVGYGESLTDTSYRHLCLINTEIGRREAFLGSDSADDDHDMLSRDLDSDPNAEG